MHLRVEFEGMNSRLPFGRGLVSNGCCSVFGVAGGCGGIQNRGPKGLWSASGGYLAPGRLRATFLSDLKPSWAPRGPQEGAKLEPKSMKHP